MIRVAIANQPPLDFGFTAMGTIVGIEKLRRIRDTSIAPGLATAKTSCAGRSPQHRNATVHHRANKILLTSSKMAGLSYKDVRLIQAAELNAKPPLIIAGHTRANLCSGNLLIPVGTPPSH